MDITNRSDVEQFFRNQPLYKMATTIEEIEKNLWQYSSHELDWDYETLSIDYSIGNTDEFDSKDYPMQEFLDFVNKNTSKTDKIDNMIWVEGEWDLEFVFDLQGFIEANETALVKEFYNANK